MMIGGVVIVCVVVLCCQRMERSLMAECFRLDRRRAEHCRVRGEVDVGPVCLRPVGHEALLSHEAHLRVQVPSLIQKSMWCCTFQCCVLVRRRRPMEEVEGREDRQVQRLVEDPFGCPAISLRCGIPFCPFCPSCPGGGPYYDVDRRRGCLNAFRQIVVEEVVQEIERERRRLRRMKRQVVRE